MLLWKHNAPLNLLFYKLISVLTDYVQIHEVDNFLKAQTTIFVLTDNIFQILFVCVKFTEQSLGFFLSEPLGKVFLIFVQYRTLEAGHSPIAVPALTRAWFGKGGLSRQQSAGRHLLVGIYFGK